MKRDEIQAAAILSGEAEANRRLLAEIQRDAWRRDAGVAWDARYKAERERDTACRFAVQLFNSACEATRLEKALELAIADLEELRKANDRLREGIAARRDDRAFAKVCRERDRALEERDQERQRADEHLEALARLLAEVGSAA